MGASAAAQRYCNWAASSACSNRALQQPTQVKSQAQRPINKRKQWKEPGHLTAAANGCHTTVTRQRKARLMAATPQALWLPNTAHLPNKLCTAAVRYTSTAPGCACGRRGSTPPH